MCRISQHLQSVGERFLVERAQYVQNFVVRFQRHFGDLNQDTVIRIRKIVYLEYLLHAHDDADADRALLLADRAPIVLAQLAHDLGAISRAQVLHVITRVQAFSNKGDGSVLQL